MIVIKIWQLVAAVVVLFVGVYFIVEYRINKNNLVVSEFILIKEKTLKQYINRKVDFAADIMDKIQTRLVEEVESNHIELSSKIVKLIEKVEDKYGRND